MPTERLSMRRIRDVLRWKHAEQLSERVIAGTLQISHGVVNAYLQRARNAGLAWPMPDGLDDDGLEQLLFPKPPATPIEQRPMPDWTFVDKEFRRRSVTRALSGTLWEEYRGHPDGFGYTWFCTRYEAWKKRRQPSMRQTHVAGAKVFVDFAGDTIDITDPETGELRAVKLLRRDAGRFELYLCEACESESLPDWISVHAGLFASAAFPSSLSAITSKRLSPIPTVTIPSSIGPIGIWRS